MAACSLQPSWCCRQVQLLRILYLSMLWMALVVQAKADLNEEAAAPAGGCQRRRDLSTTIWGSIVTILALAADYWGDFGPHLLRKMFTLRTAIPTIVGVLNVPLLHPNLVIRQAVQAWALSRALPSSLKQEKRKCKIIIACTVWVNVHASLDPALLQALESCDESSCGDHSDLGEIVGQAFEYPRAEWNIEDSTAAQAEGTLQESDHAATATSRLHSQLSGRSWCKNSLLLGWVMPWRELDNTEALRIQSKMVGCRLIKLNVAGKRWFLSSGIFPRYEQLKFLQTRNALGITIAAIQAAGYLLAILERLVLKLKVSPLEALALPMAVLVLLQAALNHFTAGSCNRPLLIHLHADQAQSNRLQANLEHHQQTALEYLDEVKLQKLIAVVLGALLAGPSIAFAVYFIRSPCKHCHGLGAGAFLLAMVTYVPMMATYDRTKPPNAYHIFWSCATLAFLAVSAGLAIYNTASDWRRFSLESKSLPQLIIPYIG